MHFPVVVYVINLTYETCPACCTLLPKVKTNFFKWRKCIFDTFCVMPFIEAERRTEEETLALRTVTTLALKGKVKVVRQV